MRKNTGKIILCVVATIILIAAGFYMLKLDKDMNDRISRLKKGTRVEVVVSELPTGNYSSDTEKYIWKYSYVDANGKTVTTTTAGRYTRAEVEATYYKMNVLVAGTESAEEQYVMTVKKENYDGAIIYYCLALVPLMLLAWLIVERRLYEEVLKKGEVRYAEFVGAFREGAYYKVKFAYEQDGKRVVKSTKPAYTINAVEVFKGNGVIEIKCYKNRAVISQRIFGIKN